MNFYLAALLQGLCLVPMGLGIYLTMKIFNFPDITTDGSYTLGAVICALGLQAGISIFVLLPCIVLGGALAGLCTAFIHTQWKINPLLSGILVMTALYSVNLSLLGRSNVPLLNYKTLFSIHLSGADTPDHFLVVGGLVLLLFALLTYVLKSDLGIAMRATGNNEQMVKAQGINTHSMKWMGLALANGLTALSGSLIAQFQSFTDINMGIGIVISGLGAVMIAESIRRLFQRESVWLSLILVVGGVLLFQWVLAFTLSLGLDASLLKLITSCFVLLIVALPNATLWKGLTR